LQNEPVIARPPSRWYRIQKGFRRNKAAYLVTAGIAAVLVIAMLVSLRQAIRATRAENLAGERLAESEVITRFLTEDLLFQATPDQTARERGITMEQVLEKAVQRLGDNPQIANHPLTEAKLRIAIGLTYRKLGVLSETERQLRRAVELRRRELGTNHLDTLIAQKELVALLLGDMNRFNEETERLSRETWQSLHRLLEAQKSHHDNTNLYRAMLDGESEYLWALGNRGDLETAVRLKRINTASYEELFGPDDEDSVRELHNLAMLLTRNGDFAEAERCEEESLRRYAKAGKTTSDSVFTGIAGLAACRFFLGNTHGAESLLIEAIPRATRHLGHEHPATLHLQSYLARVLAEQGRLEDAEALARSTMLARQRVLGTNAFNTAYTTLILGRVLVKRDRLAEALPLLESARAVFREQFPKIPAFSAEAENWLGAIHLGQGDLGRAKELLVPGVDYLMSPTAFLSAQERRESIGHVVKFYEASGNSNQAVALTRRLDEIGNLGSSEPSRAPTNRSTAN
jgi:tetratricopeptide (TPR) repeat protein